MAKRPRSDTTKMEHPSLRGALMVDTVHGKVRVRKWPKPRGKSKNPKVLMQNKWFAETTKMLKYAAPEQVISAMVASKGTGLYPRDVLMAAAAGNLYEVQDPDGHITGYRRKFIVPVIFQGLIAYAGQGLSLPAGSYTQVPWALPELDTAGFWQVGEPATLIVPEGVQVINVSFYGTTTPGSASVLTGTITKNSGSQRLTQINSASRFSNNRVSMSTGPVVVEAGEDLQCQLNPASEAAIDIASTRIGITILEAI